MPVNTSIPGLNMQFISDQVGWMIITLGSSPLTFSDNLYMMRDGGQHWTRQTLLRPQGIASTDAVTIEPLGFAHGQIGFLRVTFTNMQQVPVQRSSYIYISLDSGRSWHRYSGKQPSDPFSTPVAQIDVWQLVRPICTFLSPDQSQLSLALLRHGAWETQVVPLPVNDGSDICLSRFSAQFLFLRVRTFLEHDDQFTNVETFYKSTDGGQHWQQLSQIVGE
ncbi:MAG TPA: hypothetical protein VFN35_09295 [Ktedonobacteraceae bacterium]|nr:hypothetical protein [Ktedonobacteraceae bacterium]